jgi:hypothetical protein
MNDDLFDYKATENLFYGPGGVKSSVPAGGAAARKDDPESKWLGWVSLLEGAANVARGIRGMPEGPPGAATQALQRMASERQNAEQRQQLLAILQATGAFEQGRAGGMKMSGQNPAVSDILGLTGSQAS